MLITFMRHARTVNNDANIFTGQLDCDVSIEGLKEAQMHKIKKDDYDVYYCSCLKRTKQTLDVICPGINPIYDSRINEINIGILAGKPITDETRKILNDSRVDANNKYNIETIDHMKIRISSFIDDLEDKYDDNIKILVVCHSGILTAIKDMYFGKTDFYEKNKNLSTITIDTKKDKKI